ncbi:carbohydrate ABC transporter substrate-binding protein, partial [Turicibacter sanguinis]|nr:carbohydrate ABC transporter substrate-binding protein [Turicibacter sanguinis]
MLKKRFLSMVTLLALGTLTVACAPKLEQPTTDTSNTSTDSTKPETSTETPKNEVTT